MENKALFAPHRRLFLVGVSALGLSACGNILGPGEPPQIYTLHPAPSLPAGAPVSWSLAVGLPDASASLDTQRIALTRSGTTMDYYANAAWPDTLTLMVQQALLAAFQDSGRLASVSREQDALHADYTLMTDIREFTAHYSGAAADGSDGPPRITITLVAQMVASHGRKTIASLTATESAPASVNSVDAAVQAFDAALAAAIAKLVAWAVALPPPPTPPVAAP